MFSTYIHVKTLGCLLPRMDGTMMKKHIYQCGCWDLLDIIMQNSWNECTNHWPPGQPFLQNEPELEFHDISGYFRWRGRKISKIQKKQHLGEKNLQKPTFTSTFWSGKIPPVENWSLSSPRIHSATQRKPQLTRQDPHGRCGSWKWCLFSGKHVFYFCRGYCK